MKSLVWELKEERRVEKAYELIEEVKELCPPGIEWGFEIARLPGVSYIAEGGRIVALSVARGEFGPFMDSRLKEVPVKSIPLDALSRIVSDPDGFLQSLVSHLRGWLKSAPPNHPLRAPVERFLAAIG